MALQLLNLGSGPDDGTGDPGRTGGQKINDNFTELYSYATGAAAFPGDISITDDLDVGGHAAIGASASVAADAILTLQETLTEDGNNKSAMRFLPTVSGAYTGFGGTHTGLSATMTYSSTPTLGAVGANGMQFVSAINTTTSLLSVTGIRATVSNVGGSSGAITTANVMNLSQAFSGTRPTSINGLAIENMGSGGATNSRGILINKVVGSTNNYGIVLNGDDLGADISFGASQDVRQHFNGTNLEFQGSGIAHTASTVTHDGYVTIAINGVAYNFMTGT